jgi:hypothetical protein
MAGGTLEYLALLWGYQSLLLLALALYLIAALFGEPLRRRISRLAT